jgi:putative acetyltransferase
VQDVTLELATNPTDEVRALVTELEQVLAAEYPPEQRHGLSVAALFEPHVRLFVARQDDEAVGCGGVALFADFAEVKRMFVRPHARGRGVAQAVLARIEAEARGAGLSVLRLETGVRQTASMRLYERWGFRKCEAFGAYAQMPAQAIVTSVFYEKPIGPCGP